jgi:NADH dehydrogenase FAD-containing subunit
VDKITHIVPKKLVITVGAYANTFNIPGVKEHALFLKEVKHAMAIRQRIIECFETASEPGVSEQDQIDLLHFAIVGGGPTGIEFSAELHDFIMEDLARLYASLLNKVRITVFDNAPKILGGFDSALGEYASKKFARKGIDIRTNTKITQVEKNHLVLDNGTKVPFGTLVWATGITATPLVRALEVAKDKTSRIVTNEFLEVLDNNGNPIKDTYALGDCAAIKDNALPATAQVAAQKGMWLKKHLNKLVQGQDSPKPFVYRHMGSMVYTGSWSALMDLRGATNMTKGIKGRLAWIG